MNKGIPQSSHPGNRRDKYFFVPADHKLTIETRQVPTFPSTGRIVGLGDNGW